jgi:exodeoxyribonuclease VII large subunit
MATALNNIRSRISQLIDGQVQLIANARSRPMLANPYAFVETHQEQLNQVTSRLRTRFGQQLELAEQSVDHLRQQVRALSPQSTLDRGYAVVQTNDGQVVRSAKAVKAGAKLQIRVAEGTIAATAETSTVE